MYTKRIMNKKLIYRTQTKSFNASPKLYLTRVFLNFVKSNRKNPTLVSYSITINK